MFLRCDSCRNSRRRNLVRQSEGLPPLRPQDPRLDWLRGQQGAVLLTISLLAILLAASEGLYLLLLRLDAVNGVRPVSTFLVIMGACFVLYFAANWVLQRGSAGNWGWCSP